MAFILCPTVLGYSADQSLENRRLNRSSFAPGRTQNTPQDRIPSSKTYSLQRHREMGVMKQDCTCGSNLDGVPHTMSLLEATLNRLALQIATNPAKYLKPNLALIQAAVGFAERSPGLPGTSPDFMAEFRAKIVRMAANAQLEREHRRMDLSESED